MDAIKKTFGLVGAAVEAVGVVVILAGFAAALVLSVPRLRGVALALEAVR